MDTYLQTNRFWGTLNMIFNVGNRNRTNSVMFKDGHEYRSGGVTIRPTEVNGCDIGDATKRSNQQARGFFFSFSSSRRVSNVPSA